MKQEPYTENACRRVSSDLATMNGATMKTKPGRPTRLTPEVASVIVASIRNGMTVKAATDNAGVARSTVLHWLQRGRKEGKGKFRQLLDDITRARSELMREALQVINDAISGRLAPKRTVKTVTDPVGQRTETTVTTAPPDVHTAKWMLERKFRDEFASAAKDLKELKAVIKYLIRIIESNGIRIDQNTP